MINKTQKYKLHLRSIFKNELKENTWDFCIPLLNPLQRIEMNSEK